MTDSGPKRPHKHTGSTAEIKGDTESHGLQVPSRLYTIYTINYLTREYIPGTIPSRLYTILLESIYHILIY